MPHPAPRGAPSERDAALDFGLDLDLDQVLTTTDLVSGDDETRHDRSRSNLITH